MLNEVMSQILQAEKSAEEIVAKAAADAKDIHLVSITETDKIIKEFEAETKRQVNEILKKARDEGEARAAENIKAVKASAEDQTQKAIKNIPNAVEFVADGITKKYGKK